MGGRGAVLLVVVARGQSAGAHAGPRVVLQPNKASEIIAQPTAARSKAMCCPSERTGKIGKIANVGPRSAAQSAKAPWKAKAIAIPIG